jgi:voltage-gated potassium channel
VILERDKEKVQQAHKDGFSALTYDSGSLHSYKAIKIDIPTQVRAVILLRDSDVLNVYTALTIRELSKKVTLLSILHQDENRRKLSFAGINEIVYTQELIGLISKEVSGRPVAFEVIHALRSENSGVFIEEIGLDAMMAEHFFEIARLPLFYKRLIVLGIYNTWGSKFLFNPSADLTINEGDVAIVIATRSLIDEFKILMYQKGKK